MKKNKFALLVVTIAFFGIFFAADVFAQTGRSALSDTINGLGVPEVLEPSERIDITVPDVQIQIPGLNFSDRENIQQVSQVQGSSQTTFLHVPFLAEYIAAVYKYAIAVASVLAVIMIVIAGFQWTVSGGNVEAITRAKKRITSAIVGLLLAIGSYSLLANINPELVSFRSVKIQYIATEDLDDSFAKGNLTGGKRTATTITEGGMGTALKVWEDVKNFSPKINRNLYIEDECPLKNHKKQLSQAESDRLVTTGGQNSFNYSNFDNLFKAYGKCLKLPWQILKATAYRESNFKSSAVNPYGFTGLFQTKVKYCKSALAGYGLAGNCSNLADPQVSTMVGTAMLINSQEKIITACGDNVDPQALVFYLYIGHHQGAGNLRKALNAVAPDCKMAPSCKVFYTNWNKQKKYKEDLDANKACDGYVENGKKVTGIIERLKIEGK